jgi:hypothetical protein
MQVSDEAREAAASFLETWEPGPEMTVVKLARAFQSAIDAARADERQSMETRFWSIVDPNSVPSDMWEALNRMAEAYRSRNDAIAAAYARGLRDAAGVVERFAADVSKSIDMTLASRPEFQDSDAYMATQGNLAAARHIEAAILELEKADV